jgi:hypothetical protein
MKAIWLRSSYALIGASAAPRPVGENCIAVLPGIGCDFQNVTGDAMKPN